MPQEFTISLGCYCLTDDPIFQAAFDQIVDSDPRLQFAAILGHYRLFYSAWITVEFTREERQTLISGISGMIARADSEPPVEVLQSLAILEAAESTLQ